MGEHLGLVGEKVLSFFKRKFDLDPQSTQRVAMAIFLRPFHHVGKIMKVKVGGGHTLPPSTLSNITSKAVVYAPTERADTLPLFLLYHYIYSVVRSFCPFLL